MEAIIFLEKEIKQFKREVTYRSVENQKKLRRLIEEIIFQTMIRELSLDDAEVCCYKLFKYYSELTP